jgi:glutamyl-tRNA synthetase
MLPASPAPLPLSSSVRTRFAPSPTGFIHFGNIRSALYPWAFARKTQGTFILRIEDTDGARSSAAASQMILDSMAWLGLNVDAGPFYQTQRSARYAEVIAQLLAAQQAYYCYMTPEALDALRAAQRARAETPRYDGRWRPEAGKHLPVPPAGVRPVVRFKNPTLGTVIWQDAVKGRIEIANEILDDLIIARQDGTPTYNFCAAVDDSDMQITHVIRGDDHMNNTPRQINILHALGKTPPVYAHLPTVLDANGEKMSKRNGATSLMQYRDEGYLPEAILNYLARLGWSHGDSEVFSREQFIAWFDLAHLGKSATQHNPDKLKWLNQHYIKTMAPERLVPLLPPFFARLNIDTRCGPPLEHVVALFQDRAETLLALATEAALFYRKPCLDAAALKPYMNDTVYAALAALLHQLGDIEWTRSTIKKAFQTTLETYALKMHQLALPVRLLVTGVSHTPAIDAVLEVFGRHTTLARINVVMAAKTT